MPGLLIGVVVLSVRWLPLLLWLPGLSRLSRLLLWLVCALFVGSRGLDRLPGLAVADTPLSLAPLLAQELAVGLLLLLLFAVLWGTLQSVARLLGLGLWADDRPDDSAAPARLPSTLIQIFSLCGTALFFAFDGVGVLLAVFGKSYELLPLPGSDLEPAPWLLTASRLYAIGTRLFALTLVLALPGGGAASVGAGCGRLGLSPWHVACYFAHCVGGWFPGAHLVAGFPVPRRRPGIGALAASGPVAASLVAGCVGQHSGSTVAAHGRPSHRALAHPRLRWFAQKPPATS